MSRATVVLLVVLICLLAVGAAGALGLAPSIRRYVVGSGGGRSTTSDYALDGTIGQAVVASSSSGSFRLGAGYWRGLMAQASPTGTATSTRTATPSPTPTGTLTATASPTSTGTATTTPTATTTASPTSTATGTVVATPTATVTTTPPTYRLHIPAILRKWRPGAEVP